MSDKDLNYYLGLNYPIIIERIAESDEIEFMAFSNVLGKYACYGIGTTEAEAVQSFIEEKYTFIEYLFNAGEVIPEPKKDESERFSGFFNVRTSPIIHANLVSQAKELDISLNLYLNQILAGAVEKRAADNLVLNMLSEICNQLTNHHYEVTKQLKYQTEKMTSQFKSNAEYSGPYLKFA